MDLKMIVLGAILLIVLYVLFTIFTKKRVTLGKAVDLPRTTEDAKMIAYSTMTSPASANYYILLWVYVQSLGTATSIQLYNIDAKLKLQITPKGELQYDISGNTKIVTNNFPMQKWVCVILSVDSNATVDTYIDGKLVKSDKRDTMVYATTSNSTLTLGGDNSDTDIKVALLQREPVTMDPVTAYKLYNENKPENVMGSMFSDYGVSLRLTKNQATYSGISFPTGGIEVGGTNSDLITS